MQTMFKINAKKKNSFLLELKIFYESRLEHSFSDVLEIEDIKKIENIIEIKKNNFNKKISL